jgi:CHAD domain-containing protein
MRETVERELKLRADETFELPQLGGEPLSARVFVSTYHDTADFGLARAGATLRHRVENGRGLWQLKLPRDDARLELEVEGGPGGPPADLLRLVPALTRGHELAPVARLRTRRSGIRIRDGEAVADVVLDAVSVLDGQRVTRVWDEVEVELVEGDARLLARIGKALRRAGAGDEEQRPKVFQALGLDFPRDGADGMPAGAVEALRRMFRLQLDRILLHDPGVRIGDDPEDLHQLRVATRRLRAFLRAARPLLVREWAEELRAELGWLGAALGPVRDLDVLLEHLREEAAGLDEADRRALEGVFDQLEEGRNAARAELLAVLESDRYLALLDRIEQAAELPRTVDERRTLPSLWRREWKRLQAAVAVLDAEPEDEALHTTRIKAKRARYAAELAGPALGRAGERFVVRAKRLQDTLGEHQDAVVAEERVRALLRGSRATGTAFAAGRLVERQRARRVAARAGFAEAWERLERAGRRAERA